MSCVMSIRDKYDEIKKHTNPGLCPPRFLWDMSEKSHIRQLVQHNVKNGGITEKGHLNQAGGLADDMVRKAGEGIC